MDKFDAHMKLAEFHMNVRKARQQYEWRVSLALWVGLGAGVLYVKKVPIQYLAPILVAMTAGHACLWVVSHYSRNERDAQRAYSHVEKAEELLHGSRVHLPPAKRSYAPPVFQVLATIALAIAWLINNCLK